MPSRRRASLIDGVAERLGSLGNLPVHRALVPADAGSDAPAGFGYQADQANSAHQVANVWGRFSVDAVALSAVQGSGGLEGPVLLIDDEAHSRWTLTVAGHLLREAGTGPVLPFVLRTR